MAIHLGLIAFLFYWTFVLVHPFIPIMVWSVVLTVALYPVFNWLTAALGGRSRLSALLITIAGLLIIVGPATWLAVGLVESLPRAHRADRTRRADDPAAVGERQGLAAHRPAGVQGLLAARLDQYRRRAELPAAATEVGRRVPARSGEQSGRGHAGVPRPSVVITGFLFTRGPNLLAATKTLARRVDPEYGETFVSLAGATIRAVSRGVIGISLLQAIIGGVGMSLAGVPFASVLTLGILLLGIVQIGPLAIVVPLAIWGWMELSTAAALAFTVCMAAVYIVEAFGKPFVLAHGLTTPTLVIFIGVIGGILAHGIPGLFAGPIVLAVAWEIAKAWIYERDEAPAAAQARD